MTGPEHYREAEKLLHLANQGHNQGNENEDRMTAQAQVHATLALAAAQTRAMDFGERMGEASMVVMLAGLEGYSSHEARTRLRQVLGMPEDGAA